MAKSNLPCSALVMRLGLVGLAAVLVAVGLPAAAQDGNLLVNGSMEGGYSAQDGIPQLQMPNGWRAWWIEGGAADWANLRPEWSNSSASAGYAERVMSGDLAMRYFKGWATFTAGAYQTVGGITPGTNLEFTAWGHSWSCLRWEECSEARPGLPPRVWSTNEASRVRMRIGIDPTGGTDPFSGNVVWSPTAAALDQYVQFRVTATAQADRVTVFLYATQDYPAENQDAYWDDAVLRVAGAGGAPAGGEAAPAGGVGVAVIPTYPPRDDGRIIHTVRSGETLGGIAYAYGLPNAQAVRDLNNLTGDIIYAGQELLVGQVEGVASAEATETAAPGGSQGADLHAEAEEAEATRVAAAASTTGSVCVEVFEDANQNRTFDASERLLGGTNVSLKREAEKLASYRTDGVSEPYCFAELEPGDYMVEVEPPRAYGATTDAQLPVRVEVGAPQQVAFGLARGVSSGAAALPAPSPLPPAPATARAQGGIRDALSQWAGVAVLALALLLTLAWVIWRAVRR